MKWMPIESAPKDGSQVLVHGATWNGPAAVAEWDITFHKWFDFSDGAILTPPPTHWMPLPERPK